jgi:hypothetical protein
MHKHNLDVIAEYAGGTLADDTTARTLVATCEVCRAEYESHKSVLDALAGVQPVAMTGPEKARLHRDIATELRSPRSKRGRLKSLWPTWVASAAAVLVVTVGLAGVLNSMGGADSVSETFSEIGSALDGGAARGLHGEEADSDATADAGPQASAGDEDYFYDESNGYASVAKSARELTNTTSNDTASSGDNECLEESGLIDYRLVPDVERLTRLLVAVSTKSGDSTPNVAFIDPDTCEVVHLED